MTTAREFVIRSCELKGFDLSKPTKANPDILVMDWTGGFGRVIVDAKTWADASVQLRAVASK